MQTRESFRFVGGRLWFGFMITILSCALVRKTKLHNLLRRQFFRFEIFKFKRTLWRDKSKPELFLGKHFCERETLWEPVVTLPCAQIRILAPKNKFVKQEQWRRNSRVGLGCYRIRLKCEATSHRACGFRMWPIDSWHVKWHCYKTIRHLSNAFDLFLIVPRKWSEQCRWQFILPHSQWHIS